MCFMILQIEKKERLCRLKKQEVQKLEKLGLFQRGQSMGLVKNWQLFHLFILSKIGHENVFYDTLDRKKGLFRLKNKKFKKSKIRIFPKGLVYGFDETVTIFVFFFYQAKEATKMCFTILSREKTPFQAKNTISSKSNTKCDFFKGVSPWFWSKIGNFSIFLS